MAKIFPNTNTFIGKHNELLNLVKKDLFSLSKEKAVKTLYRIFYLRKELLTIYFLPCVYEEYPENKRLRHVYFDYSKLHPQFKLIFDENIEKFHYMPAMSKLKTTKMYNLWEVKEWFLKDILSYKGWSVDICKRYNELINKNVV